MKFGGQRRKNRGAEMPLSGRGLRMIEADDEQVRHGNQQARAEGAHPTDPGRPRRCAANPPPHRPHGHRHRCKDDEQRPPLWRPATTVATKTPMARTRSSRCRGAAAAAEGKHECERSEHVEGKGHAVDNARHERKAGVSHSPRGVDAGRRCSPEPARVSPSRSGASPTSTRAQAGKERRQQRRYPGRTVVRDDRVETFDCRQQRPNK